MKEGPPDRRGNNRVDSLRNIVRDPRVALLFMIPGAGTTLRVKRELEGGWFQWINMPLPAVLTIQSGINKLRYATLMGIKKARSKEMKVLKAADLNVAPEPQLTLERISVLTSSGVPRGRVRSTSMPP